MVVATSGRTYVAGSCRRCNKAFVIIDQLTNSYCSKQCGTADGRARRRARKRDGYVADVRRQQIFERDRWRCQLCRKPVARTKQVPHPKAPVLDHIIPLAKGGTHEPKNVQCAHHLCNCRKSDRATNDQLRLL
jgi:5-methylcytosine-specific restriction endonuclease McrA